MKFAYRSRHQMLQTKIHMLQQNVNANDVRSNSIAHQEARSSPRIWYDRQFLCVLCYTSFSIHFWCVRTVFLNLVKRLSVFLASPCKSVNTKIRIIFFLPSQSMQILRFYLSLIWNMWYFQFFHIYDRVTSFLNFFFFKWIEK